MEITTNNGCIALKVLKNRRKIFKICFCNVTRNAWSDILQLYSSQRKEFGGHS